MSDNARPSLSPSCKECEAFIDSRCPECGCCNHAWNEDTCPCNGQDCGCRENREWDEAEASQKGS